MYARRVKRRRRVTTLAVAGLIAGGALAACGGSSATPASTSGVTSTTRATSTGGTTSSGTSGGTGTGASLAAAFPHVTGSQILNLEGTKPYTPHPPSGGTDDYHCTLLDPHVTQDAYIIANHFFPNSPEVHHAILFEVPPAVVAEAKATNKAAGGNGWTCFGETALPGQGLASLGQTPWLSAWAPGHGLDQTPAGTGVWFPKGSMVVMQIHYNLLAGDKPVQARLELQTVPASHKLQPLHLDLLPAAPDIPCPSGVHGPLCDRGASLTDLSQRFGPQMVAFVDGLEQICGRNPQNPPAGDSTSCTWPVTFNGKLLRLTPHMHLLGASMRFILDPGTPQQKMLLDVKQYNFDYQRSYDIAPITVHPGDRLEVSCTFSPRLRQELPQLRRLAPRFVTWGDGSSDEMCLGLVSWVAS
jgi:hypothetical protein